jgi:hypothetical protein
MGRVVFASMTLLASVKREQVAARPTPAAPSRGVTGAAFGAASTPG